MGVNTLFLDMNSFFASVEQQVQPELRGRPVAVAAVLTDSTCCIAASYEAKAFGIRTGTPVWQARKLCRKLRVIEAKPELYVRFHHKIAEAVERHAHVTRIDSIDEMWCRLMGPEHRTERAVELAQQIKRSIYSDVGEHLRCSIGLAPNRVLAKVAADMQKPDGLTVLDRDGLPQSLYGLALDDFPGIGPRMLMRLHRYGVQSVEQLCSLSELKLRQIWQGVMGSWWWHWLRGQDLREPATHRRSVGHSHVLPSGLRTDAGAKAVLIRLIHKAAARLRMMNHWAGRMEVYLSYSYDREEGWSGEVELGLCQDTLTMVEAFEQLWPLRPPEGTPTQVAITLLRLTPGRSATLPLFPEAQRRTELARVIDAVNSKLGPQTVYLGATHEVRTAAPTRIAFSHVPGFDAMCE